MFLLVALLIGVIAGLRAMTAPAAVAWGAALGWFDVSQTPLAFMAYQWAPWIFTLLAVVELITDQLPSTPSRKVPVQFGARIVMGGLAGATIGAANSLLFGGLIVGVIGAVIGTYGGAAVRGRLAASFGKDLPAALIEDAVAVIGALLIVAVS
ncbi:membrane protein [Rhizobium leguminosarum]|uniref:membrane protein n=1 Tax=Rhizobium leguminosarum TaxID=384 RepID=UPI0003760A85|nr:membrane protein [Rhizobium leguminosarum]